jgi:hypothetical protein
MPAIKYKHASCGDCGSGSNRNGFDKIVNISGTTAGNDRYGDRVADRANKFEVIAGHRPIAIHSVHKNFAGSGFLNGAKVVAQTDRFPLPC